VLPDSRTAGDDPDAGPDEDPGHRPEDVREGVVDLVAYAVGAISLIALGYFTQRDVLTWTRGPFVVVCIIMAVHWVGRRIRAARTGDAPATRNAPPAADAAQAGSSAAETGNAARTGDGR
jgi:hypothetical protein